jgi:hypothetical protein
LKKVPSLIVRTVPAKQGYSPPGGSIYQLDNDSVRQHFAERLAMVGRTLKIASLAVQSKSPHAGNGVAMAEKHDDRLTPPDAASIDF